MLLTFITAAYFCRQISSLSDTSFLKLNDNRFEYKVEKRTGKSLFGDLSVWKQGKLVQLIPLSGLASEQANAGISLRDINFDGQADLMILNERGNVNSSYNFWIYDRRTEKFVLNRLLSKRLAGYDIKLDPENKTITTAARNGCCEHVWNTFRINGQQIKLVNTKKGH